MKKDLDTLLSAICEDGNVSDLGPLPEPPIEEDEGAVDQSLADLADDLADAFVDAMAGVLGGGEGTPADEPVAGDDLDQVDALVDNDTPPAPAEGDDDGDEDADMPVADVGGEEEPDVTEPPAVDDQDDAEETSLEDLEQEVSDLEDENKNLRNKIAKLSGNEAFEEFEGDVHPDDEPMGESEADTEYDPMPESEADTEYDPMPEEDEDMAALEEEMDDGDDFDLDAAIKEEEEHMEPDGDEPPSNENPLQEQDSAAAASGEPPEFDLTVQ